MSARVAINGLGRIGRAVLKLVIEQSRLELAAANDLPDAGNLAYLLRFDTVYGRYSKPGSRDGETLVVDDHKLRMLCLRDPAQLPWKELGVDVAFECTGVMTKPDDLQKHVRAGALFVLLSTPSKGGEVETVVHGVNAPGGKATVISCAIDTTNCITPTVEIMGRRIGIKKAITKTVHAYTSTQSIVDGPSKRFRRGRAGGASLVLTSRPTRTEEVNQLLSEEAEARRYQGVLGVSRAPLASSDIIGDSRAPRRSRPRANSRRSWTSGQRHRLV